MIGRALPLLVCLALSGCAGQMPSKMEIPLVDAPGSKQKMLSQLTPGKYEASLMSIGSERDLAQERGRHMGFVKNQEIDGYLNGIRERLLAASGISEVPGKVLVVANTAYMAKASADGNIYISMAWLPDVQLEEELAAIVAHELAHVLLKHQSTNIIGLTQKRLQSAHELLLGGKMSVTKTSQLGQGDQKALLAAQLSVELIDKVAMPAWNRRQETEADLLGLDLLVRAGYSLEGMTAMLTRLERWEAGNRESEKDLQARLKQLAGENLDQALKTAFKAAVDELSKEHPETDKRLEAVADYIDRHYTEAPYVEPNSAAIRKFRSTRGVAPLLDNYRSAIGAKKLLQEGKLTEAYNKARLGVQAPTASAPLPNWILWQTAKAVGKQRQHHKALESALNSPEPIQEVYKEAIGEAERSGDNARALQLVDLAGKSFGDTAEWAPDRIRLLSKLGRKKEANAEAIKCAVDTPQQRKECYAAAKS